MDGKKIKGSQKIAIFHSWLTLIRVWAKHYHYEEIFNLLKPQEMEHVIFKMDGPCLGSG